MFSTRLKFVSLQNLWQKHWGCIDPFDYVTVEKYLRYIQYVKKNKSLQGEVVQLLPYLFKVNLCNIFDGDNLKYSACGEN